MSENSKNELNLAEEENRQQRQSFQDLVLGLLDCSFALFFFLPLFGQKSAGGIQEVSLLFLTGVSPWLRMCYLASVAFMALWGILILALQNCRKALWVQHKSGISLLLSGVSALLFIISQQPYAAALLFIFLAIKVLTMIKKR